MKKSLLQQLFRLGTTEEMDFRLERRIILSNQFALVIAGLTVLFIAAFVARSNFNVLPLVVMLLLACIIWVLNYSGLTKLSRTIISLIPAVGLLFINLSLKFSDPSTIDILHYATPRMLILGSVVLPFTMFTPGERSYMFSCVATIIILAFGYDLIHQWLSIDYESLGITNEHYGIIYEDLVVLGVMILLSSGFMFRMGSQYDLKTQKMLEEAHKQTEQLRSKEETMQQTLKDLEESKKKDEERNWVSKGLAEMIAILQAGNDETEKLFDKLLSKLVKYCDFNQGALFVVDEGESEKELRMASCYAYSRKKFMEGRIDLGSGLLGQVYLEGERCYLKDVPSDHLKITSGLGEATPRHLVLIPMKVNNVIEGVLELASFTAMEQRHFDLLDQLGENLASYIANNRVNVRTKKLLEQAQTMSAEMRENEEEMRQNLEELQATQEALARKEKEYQDRIEVLENELKMVKGFAKV